MTMPTGKRKRESRNMPLKRFAMKDCASVLGYGHTYRCCCLSDPVPLPSALARHRHSSTALHACCLPALPRPAPVCARRQVRTEALCPADEFLLVACDGLFDVMSRQESVDFVRAALRANGNHPGKAACAAASHAVQTKGSTDNVSVLVIQIRDCAPP